MTYKNYLQDAEDDYMMTVTTICGPATVFTFNRVISNTDPDKDYPLPSLALFDTALFKKMNILFE